MKQKIVRRARHGSSFVPAMDWWVAVGVALTLIVLVVLLPAVLWSGAGAWQTSLLALLLVWAILYVVDGSFFTLYHVQRDGLLISSQLRHYFIPYRSMSRVRPVGWLGLVSAVGRKRFALSARGYDINLYDLPWRVVSVSPRDRDAFLEALHARLDAVHASQIIVDA